MNVFRIILGIIIAALGLGMTSAGWAVVTYGQWAVGVNVFIGLVLAFLGLGVVWSGVMLIRGATVQDALGGIVSALQGHGGVGLPSREEDTYIAPDNFKNVLLEILRYAVIALVVILIAIFSVGRVMRDFRLG